MKISFFQQKTQYKIKVEAPNRKPVWIEESVPTIKWGGNTSTAARTLEIECMSLDGKTEFPLGSQLYLYDDDGPAPAEIMRGIIVRKDKSGHGASIKYKAFDLRWWLVKNKHDRKYENMSASEIVMDCCKSFGIPYGTLVDTGIKFDVLHFVNKTLWDTIITALTETRKRNGKKYVTKVKEGRMTLVEKLTQVHKWIIEEGVNLIDSTYAESIENAYTQVRVVGKDKNKNEITAVSRDEESQKKYGLMQEIIEQAEAATQDEINVIAAQKLKELASAQCSGTITTIGINGVEAGDAIHVIDKSTGLVGGFYISSDDHTYSKRHHTMRLVLSWTDELPEIDYKAPTDSE